MITVRDITKTFGSQLVLDSISIDFEGGKTTAIVGPSGTGKSVLLKIITGLMDSDSGEVLIEGESMTRADSGSERRRLRERMGVLFQFAALFDSMTIYENVAFPLRYSRKHISKDEVQRRTLECIDKVGMRGYESAYPGEISIGMRKRIGIARALVGEPEVILFDEPNTGLDPLMGQEIYELIVETQESFGITGIVISHEIPEVFQVCSRVVMLYGGRVQFDGSIDEFKQSDSAVVRQFTTGSVEGPIQIS